MLCGLSATEAKCSDFGDGPEVLSTPTLSVLQGFTQRGQSLTHKTGEMRNTLGQGLSAIGSSPCFTFGFKEC